jgi:hypothetical protein
MGRTMMSAAVAILLATGAWAQQGPPRLCKPCLFYGGDANPSDPNQSNFYNENTIVYKDTSTYGAVLVPRGHIIQVEGILFQVQFVPDVLFDPNGVTWEIRSNVSDGSGGTLIASGQGPVAKEPTGRFEAGIEYSVRVAVDPPVQLSGGAKGTVYWFNLTPQCTNPRDQDCENNQYAISNTTQQANNLRGGLQLSGRMFINSYTFDYNWEDLCELTQNGTQCQYLSFGLTGDVIQ